MAHRPSPRTLGALLLALALCVSSQLADAQTASEEDLDDLMGGFDDDSESAEVEQIEEKPDADDAPPAWLAKLPFGDFLSQHVVLSGSLGAGSVYSYLDHSVPHGDEPGRTSHYGNWTRLDLDGFLQLDVHLPGDWMMRAEALGWYDFAYRIRGRGDYAGAVLDAYEWQVDTGEVYLTGPLLENVDLTVGRKIVNWGRSDTFRVVDVINPLDNKEPGLVDIEDLRRPRTMVKLDGNAGPWSAQFLVIPENRYDRDPPRGSDFRPPPSLVQAALPPPTIDGRSDFEGMPALAGKFDGSFSSWDFSLYGAYIDESHRVFDAGGPTGLQLEANRIGMLGAAGNFTRGPWLFKAESAWLRDVAVLRFQSGNAIPSSDDNDRIDTMLGVEFYGRDNLTIAFEIVNRHLLKEHTAPMTLPLSPQSRFESGLRISRPFFRERVHLTLLALGLGERLQDGGAVRFSGDFEITDDWKLAGGWLIFIGGPDDGLGAFDSNDRLYAELKYSF